MLRAASGMLLSEAGRRAALLPLLLILVLHHANSLPLQYLPEIPGYIPVYIRHGDQPLEEINPLLAEAFHESSGILHNIREIRLDEPAPGSKDLTDRNDVSLDYKEESRIKPNAKPPVPPKQLIYTLPKKLNFPQKPKPSEKESVVMKLSKTPQLDKIDVEKITKEIKEKERNK